MKGFFKRRLPAFLLALILVVGMSPAALATETETDPAPQTETGTGDTGTGDTGTGDTGTTECAHVWDTAWSRSSSRHWHECTLCGEKDTQEHHDFSETSRVEPTCFKDGKVTSACTVCGYETEQILSATDDHDFADGWAGDNDDHWHACSNAGAGCTATADVEGHTPHDEGVVTDPTCTTDGKITYTCEICGRSYVRAGTAALGHSLDSTGKCTRDGCSYQETTSYTVTFKTGSETVTESVRVGASPTMSKVASRPTLSATNKTYTFKGWVEGTTSTYVYTGQTLATPTSAVINKNTTFSAVYTVSATKQNVTAEMDVSSSGARVGSSLRTAMNDAFKAITGQNFSSVKFSSISSSTYGKLYTSSSKSTSVASGTSYSYADVYDMYFVPTSKTTFTMTYTATDGTNTVTGTLTLDMGSTSSASGSTITYSVDAGDYVAFDRNDFKAAFDAEMDTTFRYVTFTTSSTLSSSKGAVYYDYGGSDEKYFTASSIDNYSYYYSSTAYGDYAINDLSFVAPSGAEARTVKLTYKAYDSSDNYVTGTVKIEVDGGDSSSSSDADIEYTVQPGEYVEFNRGDFESVYDAELSGTIRYVTLTTSDTLSSSAGAVYYNYGLTGQKYFTASTVDNYKYYYASSSYGDYALSSLSFYAPSGASERTVELTFRVYDSAGDYVSGTLAVVIGEGGSASSSSGSTIKYSVDAGEEVVFKKSDFASAYNAKLDGTIRYVTFTTSATLSSSQGAVYYNYELTGQKYFTKTTIDDYKFYYSSGSYGDYALGSLSYVAPLDGDDRTVELTYKVYDSAGDYVTGKVQITVGGGSAADESDGDIIYQVKPGDTVAFDRDDFNAFFQEEYSSNTIRYVTFSTSDTLSTSKGTVYFDYDGADEKSFTKTTIDDFKFYYSSSTYGDYALDDLTFVAPSSFSGSVELTFTAYYSTTKKVEGTLVIQAKDETAALKGDIIYYAATGNNVQINGNDIARYLKETYSNYSLQYVKLTGVPATGTLYYNYYGASKYGTTSKLKLTSSNCDDNYLYFSPSSTTQYALTELTYVPSGENYCVSIPFTAYASSSRSVSGHILISINKKATPDVYGVTTKGTAVTVPATAIYSAIAQSTGVQLAGIRFLELPASSVGTVYVGSGTSLKANTTTQYGYSSGTYKMSQLRFVPATGYTGSVEIPYLAYNSAGKVIASGRFCLGVVNTVRKFSDMTASTWCYKYVIELSDAGVISGYKDGTYQETRQVSYGEALKLILLAAGYDEQAKTSTHWASGYLSKARADGLISGNVNLDAPITRLAVAQIAAKALRLDTTNLSSIKPFTDTSDVYVQALNAAGIVEGYFSNGTSTYRGGNYLTRGHISAIVWRMERAK